MQKTTLKGRCFPYEIGFARPDMIKAPRSRKRRTKFSDIVQSGECFGSRNVIRSPATLRVNLLGERMDILATLISTTFVQPVSIYCLNSDFPYDTGQK